MEYTTWREDLRNFALVSKELAKGFKKADEKAAIEEFRQALLDYFSVTIASGESHHWPSWFSHFIGSFEEHVREGRSPWDDDYAVTGVADPKGTFIKRLRAAYETELPAKWSKVSAAKAQLQIVFNK